MADFNDVLTKVMSDPGAMQQISQLAQSLGLQAQPAQAPAPPPKPAPPPSAPPDAIRLMNTLLQMSQKDGGDPRQAALFKALKPFLRPERAARLDMAIQVSRMSRLAGNALQNINSNQRKGW